MGLQENKGAHTLVVKWDASDIVAMAEWNGYAMSKSDAEAWLVKNATKLENSIIDFAWDAMMSLL